MMEYSQTITRSGTISQSELLENLVKLKNEIPIDHPRKKVKNPISIYSIPAAFDIETTNWIDDNGIKHATMYIWQFGIMNYVTYGRTWIEFIIFIGEIARILETTHNLRLLVYVHNLSFEFAFLRKWLKWEKVFLLDKYVPVYALTESGIEFRCSYKLTNLSLEKIGDNLIKYMGEEFPPDVIEKAAMLAAFYSKGKNSPYVEVDYCPVSHVKKPSGAKAGMVIYEIYNTAFVKPDGDIAEKLRK